MTFDDMVQLVTVARQSGRLTIDVANFAPAAVSRFSAILDTALLELERVNVMMLAPGEIRMGASLRVGIRIDCELRFYREASGIGYTMTFGTRNALALLKGDMQVLRGLVDIDTAWWTASSRAIESLDVAITGLEAKALSIRDGLDNLHLRLGGAVLKALTLADSIFDVVLAGNIPSFSVTKRLHFALPPALQADFRRITVTADGTVTFDAQVALKLLGVAIPPMDLTLALSPVRIAIRFPLPDVPLVPGGFPIQAVRLTDTHVELNGTLGASGYGAAMDGRYILPGGSGHGGRYRFEYNAGNTSPLPDTFELGVDRLTATDALNLVSPLPCACRRESTGWSRSRTDTPTTRWASAHIRRAAFRSNRARPSAPASPSSVRLPISPPMSGTAGSGSRSSPTRCGSARISSPFGGWAFGRPRNMPARHSRRTRSASRSTRSPRRPERP
jgi:hypothetical protein